MYKVIICFIFFSMFLCAEMICKINNYCDLIYPSFFGGRAGLIYAGMIGKDTFSVSSGTTHINFNLFNSILTKEIVVSNFGDLKIKVNIIKVTPTELVVDAQKL